MLPGICPIYRAQKTHPLDIVGLILFGSGVALLSYVMEIFGEHTLSAFEMSGLVAVSAMLLAGYALHARTLAFPLLDLGLFRIRTFRAAVSGSFFTRLGIGGVPFLLPLLYQVGLGFTPIESGLLIMPQAMAAMSMKTFMPGLLRRIGYRGVLISNTLILGVLPAGICDSGPRHTGLADRATGFRLWSLHLASVHEHEYPGVCGHSPE